MSTEYSQALLQSDEDTVANESTNVFAETVSRIVNMEVPELKNKRRQMVLGLINCFIFGLGVIIAGVVKKDYADVFIGFLQMVIPFVGWVWAVVWGVLMIIR